jgi:hypothetical protein
VGRLAVESARASRFAPLLCLNLVVVGAAMRVEIGREPGGLASLPAEELAISRELTRHKNK